MERLRVLTQRLELVAGTVELAAAELEDHTRLARRLQVAIPPAWPPPLNDEQSQLAAFRYFRDHPRVIGWGSWYILLQQPRQLIGLGGFKGAPQDGIVEIGYSLLVEHQGRGLGTEVVGGLVEWAFTQPGVRRVLAETMPQLRASIRVLEKNGFALSGAGDESGALRFERCGPALTK